MGLKIKSAILAGSLAVFASAVPAYAVVNWSWMGMPTNQKELDKASTLYTSGEVDSAIQLLNQMKNGANGGDPLARHVLADIYREQRHYADAKKELSDMITVFTQYVNTHNVSPPWMNPNSLKGELGDVCAEEGNNSEAIGYYRDALQGAPTLSNVRNSLARCLINQGDLDGAKQQYNAILATPNLSTGEKVFYADQAKNLDAQIAAKTTGGGQPPPGQPGGPGGQPGYPPGQQGPPGGYQGQPGPGGQQTGMQPGMQPGGPGSGSTGSSSIGMPLSSSSPPRQTGPITPLGIAADEISSKKYDAAITRLKGIIAKTPNNAQAHYLLAVAYASSRQISSAKDEYEATLKYAQDFRLQKLASAGLAKISAKP